MTDIILKLPASIAHHILSQWLKVCSLGKLDSAYCNHEFREALLGTLEHCAHWKYVLNFTL